MRSTVWPQAAAAPARAPSSARPLPPDHRGTHCARSPACLPACLRLRLRLALRCCCCCCASPHSRLPSHAALSSPLTSRAALGAFSTSHFLDPCHGIALCGGGFSRGFDAAPGLTLPSGCDVNVEVLFDVYVGNTIGELLSQIWPLEDIKRWIGSLSSKEMDGMSNVVHENDQSFAVSRF